jgi:hypothetical protein
MRAHAGLHGVLAHGRRSVGFAARMSGPGHGMCRHGEQETQTWRESERAREKERESTWEFIRGSSQAQTRFPGLGSCTFCFNFKARRVAPRHCRRSSRGAPTTVPR